MTDREPDRLSERGVALFWVGCLAFGWPALAVFEGAGTVLGVPALYAWLFGAWAALVGALAWAAERR